MAEEKPGTASSPACPHCKSTARAIPYYERSGNALKRSFDGGVHEGQLVCDACGGPRGTAGGGPATGPGAELGASMRSITLLRASAGGLRGLGIASIGLGVLFALALGASGIGTIGLVGAAIALGGGGGIGALSLRSASKRLARAREQQQQAMEKALLAAATAAADHALTATEASRALGISVDEADKALTAMADGSRVSAEIDDDGIVHYEFRELRLALQEAAGTGVRVDLPEKEEVGVEPAPASSEKETAGR